jgi:hypothetical protein
MVGVEADRVGVAVPGGAQRAEQLDVPPGYRGEQVVAVQAAANMLAARMGPTVCKLDGPVAIENRSKTLTAI